MKNWIGFAIFCAIIWYGTTHLGWFDWVNADHGFWYETKKIFSQENVKQRQQYNQERFNRY